MTLTATPAADPAATSVATPAGIYFAPADAAGAAAGQRGAQAATVVGLHLLLAAVLGYAVLRPEIPPPVQALAVRLLEPPAPPPAKIEPPKPLPQRAAPQKTVTPPPVLAAAPAANAPASFTVAPQPEPVPAPVPTPAPAPVVQAPPAPAPVVAARFDADYLQNPKPVYPALSRRMGEEGKVVLRVRVSAQGLPLAIEIRQSSGFARLDEAARAAVERWRFVPARQGDQPVEAAVLVPLNFTLNN